MQQFCLLKNSKHSEATEKEHEFDDSTENGILMPENNTQT